MIAWFARAWRKRGLAACMLWPLSQVYRVLSGFNRELYRAGILKAERSSVPVIVVGNVVAGGAGKTPLVIALVQHFKRQGLQVGVVSRGYGRQGQHCLEVLESTPISLSGDEPALVLRSQAAPVFVANKRIEAVHALLAKYPATQVIISDDGLQHHSLARDIEITVFDDRGMGNGWLLPAGPLREPWSARPGLVLHTGQSPAFEGFKSTRRLADHAFNAAGHQVALSGLSGQVITALAGIANPEAFFDMLRVRGLRLQQTISLPDHFDFSSYAWPALKDSVVLCTEKDAIKLFKLPQFKGYNLLAVPLEFSPQPAFLAAVDAQLALLLSKSSELPSPHEHTNGH
ncbi:MAG: tetraacyldisaccharide 4'-kinase [Polaromonas sp.]|nr:tetraacyldisaccharide 4'-kinase [Polaromonas sp.]